MADDTRQPPEKTCEAHEKKYVDFAPNANAFAESGASKNTAGAHVLPKATIIDAAKTIQLNEFKEIIARPCQREALIFGIGLGFAMGGVRLILRSKLVVS